MRMLHRQLPSFIDCRGLDRARAEGKWTNMEGGIYS